MEGSGSNVKKLTVVASPGDTPPAIQEVDVITSHDQVTLSADGATVGFSRKEFLTAIGLTEQDLKNVLGR